MNELLKALQRKPEEEESRDDYVSVPQQETPIDWDTIEQFEGGRQQQGYVPQAGKSGVTLSSGFDVGQRNSLEGLPDSVKEKAAPYLGLKRGAAERKLASSGGITLTPEEADATAEFAKNETEGKLKADWQKMSDVPFEDLTPAQKTVLASVTHQYGSLSRTPRFSQFAGEGKWNKVIEELRNFEDQHKTRRNREADYLQKSMAKIK
jgi:hypothetical protein